MQYKIRKEHARLAWLAADACNLSGVWKNFIPILDELWEDAKELREGTEYVNTHPITRIFADKVYNLAVKNGGEDIDKAYDLVAKVLGGGMNNSPSSIV